MPYENIEGTTQKLALANQGVQNVHMMYQSFLDRRQRRREARGQMFTQLMQPTLEGAQERETEKLRQKGASELEDQKERLFQSRYQNQDYLKATNQPELEKQAELNLLRELQKPENKALYDMYMQIIRARNQTSHYSTSPEQEAAAKAAKMGSPDAWVAQAWKEWQAKITGEDGTVDRKRFTLEGWRTELQRRLENDEAGGVFVGREGMLDALKKSMNWYVSSYFPSIAQNQETPEVVGARELGRMKGQVEELLGLTSGVAGDPNKAMLTQALGEINRAITSPEQETTADLRGAIQTIESLLQSYSKARVKARYERSIGGPGRNPLEPRPGDEPYSGNVDVFGRPLGRRP